MNHKSEIPERMLVIDREIRSGSGPSSEKLAVICDVSSKTILRDLDFMMVYCLAPYTYDESKKGWFYLPDRKKDYSFMTYYIRSSLDRFAKVIVAHGEEADVKEATRFSAMILRNRWRIDGKKGRKRKRGTTRKH